MVDSSGHLVSIMNSLKIKISICTWRLWRWYCSAGSDQRRNCGFRLKPLKWSWTIASIRSNDTNKWRRCGRNLSCSWYTIQPVSKVIYSKYSKQWPYLLASTMNCGCSRILNHGLNHGLFLSLFKFFGWKYILNWINSG